MHHLVQRQHQRSARSIEAVNKYAQRHLSGKGTERIRIFLKALTELNNQRFHKGAVARHGKRYLEALERHPIEESQLEYYMELIPYNVLWNLLVDWLKNNRVRPGGK